MRKLVGPNKTPETTTQKFCDEHRKITCEPHNGVDFADKDGSQEPREFQAGVYGIVGSFPKQKNGDPSIWNTINVKVMDEKGNTKYYLQFLHASDIDVEVGQKVYPWTVLGKTGDTGATNVHLHVQAVDKNGIKIDPRDLKPINLSSKQLSSHAEPYDELLFDAHTLFESEKYDEAVVLYDDYLEIVPYDQDALDAKAAAELKLEKSTLPTIAKEKPQLDDTSRGGCLITTATYGTELAPQVQQLREIRDNTLLQTDSGSSFMAGFNQFYYSFSPTIANWERENPIFKEAVKITITPLLASLALLNHVNIDSEEQMLGYGIGIILLNIGMYFVAPVMIIVKIRGKFSKSD